MPEQDKHRVTKLAFQREITPEQVGGEAGKRLKELFDTADSSGRLSNEEMEEVNRILRWVGPETPPPFYRSRLCGTPQSS